MEVKITKKDVVWGYLAQFFNIGANILLLPLILHLLPSEVLGIWYIFLAISGFALMLDFGFQPTFARNVTYLLSGATKLKAEGVDNEHEKLDHPNYGLLKDLIGTMKRFYGYISLVSLFLMLTVGTWFVDLKVNEIKDALVVHSDILIAWIVFCISTILGFFYSYYNALLNGRGMIKEYNQMTIITKIVYLLFAAIGLLSGYGIIAVAVANLISVIVNRVLAVYFFRRGEILGQLKQTNKSGERLFPIIWFNAKKVGIGSVGSYFVQRGNVLFVSIFLPLDVVANFGLTSQVMNILAALTPLYLTAHLPEIYRDRINQNFYEIRRIFAESVFVFIISYAAIAAVVLFGGNFLLDLLKSETRLIPFFPLFIYLIIQFLEINHGMAAQFITTRNEVPYVKASLVSGFCIAVLTLFFLSCTDLGVLGPILSAGLVQLAYNNWKWPSVVSKELKASYPRLFVEGFGSLRQWFFRHFHS